MDPQNIQFQFWNLAMASGGPSFYTLALKNLHLELQKLEVDGSDDFPPSIR